MAQGFAGSGQSITISGPAISAGTQSGVTGTIVFSNSNGVTFGMSDSSRVTASVNAISNINVSAGTTSQNLSSLVFSNSNNVSFGLNGSTITATAAAAGGGITNINVSAGTTSLNLSALTFSNMNGVSFGLDNSTITASIVQSNQTVGLYAVGDTTGESSSSTFDARTVSFRATGGNISIGHSNGSVLFSVTGGGGGGNFSAGISGGNTAGDTGTVSNRLVLAGGNNITLSGSINAHSMTVTISGPNTAAQTNQTLGLYAVGNTTGESSSSTFDARTVSFRGDGIVSLGYSNGSVRISATESNQTLGLYVTGDTTGQSSSSTYDARTITFRATGGNISMGHSNGSFIFSVTGGGGGGGGIGAGVSTAGNTAGSTGTITTGNLVLVGSNHITLSQSTGAAGSDATVTIQGPPVLSYWQNFPQWSGAVNSDFSNALLFVIPLYMHGPFPGDMTVNTMFFNITGTVSTGAPFTRSVSIGFYTIVNSTQLSRVFSASTSWGTNAANMNVNQSFGGYRWLTFHSSQWDATPVFKAHSNYYMALWQRSSSGSQTFSFAVMPLMNNFTIVRSGFMSTASENNATLKWYPFAGMLSLSFSTAMPDTLDAASIVKSSALVHYAPHVQFNNIGSNIV